MLPESVAKARFLSQAEQDACLAVLGHDTVATRARGERIAPSSLGAVAMGDARELEDEKNVPSAKEAEEARARAGTDKVDVAKQDEEFEWREVVRGLTDIQCWLTGWAYMCLCCR